MLPGLHNKIPTCEILTGSPPYAAEDGDPLEQAARAHLEPALQKLRQSADEELVALCQLCLSPAREASPADAQEIAGYNA